MIVIDSVNKLMIPYTIKDWHGVNSGHHWRESQNPSMINTNVLSSQFCMKNKVGIKTDSVSLALEVVFTSVLQAPHRHKSNKMVHQFISVHTSCFSVKRLFFRPAKTESFSYSNTGELFCNRRYQQKNCCSAVCHHCHYKGHWQLKNIWQIDNLTGTRDGELIYLGRRLLVNI